jgi:hypothetical protein
MFLVIEIILVLFSWCVQMEWIWNWVDKTNPEPLLLLWVVLAMAIANIGALMYLIISRLER